MARLTLTTPSSTWLERLPLGNGRIGAMVGARAGETRIALNEITAWSGGPQSAARDALDPATAATALAAARTALAGGDPVSAEADLRVLQHRYAQMFLPVGEVVVTERAVPEGAATPIDAAGAPEPIARTLDLAGGVHVTRTPGAVAETACPLEPDALLHSVRLDVPTDLEVRFESPLRSRRHDVGGAWPSLRPTWELTLPADAAPGHEPGEPPVTWERAGVTPVSLVVAIEVVHDGTAEPVPGGVRVLGATRLDIVVAIESTARGSGVPGPIDEAYERARTRVDGCRDVVAALAAHRRAHTAEAGTFALTIGAPGSQPDEIVDPAAMLASGSGERLLGFLVAYARYLLRASSRPDGLPATLQGIWNAEMQPPWSSGYTLNINTPMNYWGAEVSGAGDAHLALLGLLERLAEHGTDAAARLYGARGWVAHHNTDAWGYALPTRGDASWAQWALGGAWLIRQFDEHRRHGSMTAATLERFRPVLAGCARFLLDFLVEPDGGHGDGRGDRLGDGGGELLTSPSTSPENRFVTDGVAASLTRSSALDRALVRDVLELAGDLLTGLDPHLAQDAAAAASRIPGPRVTADGRIAEWEGEQVEEDPQHRHVSHLFPWFPGDARDGLDAAAARSLDVRGDDSTGWSLGWKIALRARLGDADAVGRLLRLVVRPADDGASQRGGLYANLFAAHPPFQIDGNLGLLGAIVECVLQSHRPGRIDLLRAIPAALQTGSLRGAIARPGIRVDLDWRDGIPTLVRLRARSAETAGRYTVAFGGASVLVDVEAGSDSVVDIDALALDTPPNHPTPDRSTT